MSGGGQTAKLAGRRPLDGGVGRLPHESLLGRYGQNCSGIGTRNCEQRARCAAGLLAALFPALERAHGHAQQDRELRLRQARLFTRLNDGRRNN